MAKIVNIFEPPNLFILNGFNRSDSKMRKVKWQAFNGAWPVGNYDFIIIGASRK